MNSVSWYKNILLAMTEVGNRLVVLDYSPNLPKG